MAPLIIALITFLSFKRYLVVDIIFDVSDSLDEPQFDKLFDLVIKSKLPHAIRHFGETVRNHELGLVEKLNLILTIYPLVDILLA